MRLIFSIDKFWRKMFFEMPEIQALILDFPSFFLSISDYERVKLIGKGGYSEVWLAINKKTQEKVALKKLFGVTDKQVGQFAREVRTMISAQHPFFVKFLGFSAERSLCLYSEYMPNGSLYRFLRKEKRSRILTGTNRTQIAMAVAHAMKYLHGIGIIHRDLKSMNVLLDEKRLPKLCDFGIARFEDTEGVMTGQIGTPHWMAPEIFEGKKYNKEVDVYSFGCLIYELQTNSIPWEGKNANYIMFCIKEKRRPPIPEDTPLCLKNLIRQCWKTHSNERPKFDEIYTMFESGQVMFEGTDMKFVKHLAHRLNEYDNSEQHEIPKEESPAGNTEILDDFEEEEEFLNEKGLFFSKTKSKKTKGNGDEELFNNNLTKFKTKYHTSNPMPETHKNKKNRQTATLKDEQNVNLSIIKDPNQPNFRKELTKAIKSMDTVQLSDLIASISKALTFKINDSDAIAIIKSLRVILASKEAVKAFEKHKLYKKIAIDSVDVVDELFELLHQLFSTYPQMFQDFKGEMILLISYSPLKSLTLLALFARKFKYIEDVWQLLDLLFEKHDAFMDNTCVEEYIRTLYYLCYRFETYRDARIKESISVFCKCLTNQNSSKRVIRQCYNALALLDHNTEVDGDAIALHLLNPSLVEYAINYLLSARRIARKSSLVSSIISVIPKYPDASRILLRIAKKEEGALLLIRNIKWMENPCPTWEISLRIFLRIYYHESYRLPLLLHKSTMEFFKIISRENNLEYLKAISVVLVTEATEEIVNKVLSNKVVSELIKSAITLNEKPGYYALLDIVIAYSSVHSIDDLHILIEPIKQILHKDPSFLDPYIKKLKKIPEYVSLMKDT